MRRELGIARCGLACCLCTENADCNGCDSNSCPDNDFCENKKCSIAKELTHCYKCEETCKKGLLSKIKPYTFNLFAKKYGEEKLLDCSSVLPSSVSAPPSAMCCSPLWSRRNIPPEWGRSRPTSPWPWWQPPPSVWHLMSRFPPPAWDGTVR